MADGITTQTQLMEILPQADSVLILIRIGGKEQQFDGSWLHQVMNNFSAAGSGSSVPRGADGASLTTEDAPAYGEQPA